MSTTPLDTSLFRYALSQFATGVAIITTRAADGRKIGITANSFSSVSLNPPLVLWCLSKKASSMPIFEESSHYVINILNHSQSDLCHHFATFKGDRFENLTHPESHTGLPIIEGALAWFECRKKSCYHEGDHTIFVGEVEYCGTQSNLSSPAPLIFFNHAFHSCKIIEK